jgi:hypothetical protein
MFKTLHVYTIDIREGLKQAIVRRKNIALLQSLLPNDNKKHKKTAFSLCAFLFLLV